MLLSLALVLAQVTSPFSANAGNALQPQSPTSTRINATAPLDDVYGALRAFAAHAHINLIIDPSTPHTNISYHLRNTTDAEAFNAILDASGLAAVTRNGITYVGPPSVVIARYGTAGSNIRAATLRVAGSAATLAQDLALVLPSGTPIQPNEQSHSITVIGTQSAIEKAREFIGDPADVSYATYIPTSGRTAKQLADLFSSLGAMDAPNGLTIDDATNEVLVHGTPEWVKNTFATLKNLDTPLSQVFYSVSVVEMDPDVYQKNFGAIYGASSHGTQTGTVTTGVTNSSGSGTSLITLPGSVSLNVTLNTLESNGKAKILQRPSLVAANGTTGSTSFTTNEDFFVNDPLTGIPVAQPITTGLILSATPTVGDNIVRTDVNISSSEITGTGPQGYPITSQRTDQDVVFTRPGDYIVLGGLHGVSDSTTISGLPILDHLALIGNLFKNNNTNRQVVDVVFILQPVVQSVDSHSLPVSFPAIDPDLIQHGIAPAPTPIPTPHP